MFISFWKCYSEKKTYFLYRTPGNAKGNSGLNPEADEFVPVFTVTLTINKK
jgi:hypothetical protein